jgi:hypothetical protein
MTRISIATIILLQLGLLALAPMPPDRAFSCAQARETVKGRTAAEREAMAALWGVTPSERAKLARCLRGTHRPKVR